MIYHKWLRFPPINDKLTREWQTENYDNKMANAIEFIEHTQFMSYKHMRQAIIQVICDDSRCIRCCLFFVLRVHCTMRRRFDATKQCDKYFVYHRKRAKYWPNEKKMTLLIDEVNTLTLSQLNQHILSILSRISAVLFPHSLCAYACSGF